MPFATVVSNNDAHRKENEKLEYYTESEKTNCKY